MNKEQVINMFERGYAPGGIPLDVDAQLRHISNPGTEEHFIEIMIGYFCGRYQTAVEQSKYKVNNPGDKK